MSLDLDLDLGLGLDCNWLKQYPELPNLVIVRFKNSSHIKEVWEFIAKYLLKHHFNKKNCASHKAQKQSLFSFKGIIIKILFATWGSLFYYASVNLLNCRKVEIGFFLEISRNRELLLSAYEEKWHRSEHQNC